ncbi:NAD(P)-dependent oxidoreductase [Catenulispora pinisilvae]|uniref:NAD(P)-dependent oxidoreductase n=1 Tax=Catenulispora pinisilvae TaxID=2705253 RepID=UPI0018910431|nr:NAD(P)-dependent oxidoreductase [Catenulispora pinisilvae]
MTSASTTTSPGLSIAVLPAPPHPQLSAAVHAAGAGLCAAPEAEALVWIGDGPDELAEILEVAPKVRWVQLASVGIENYLPLMRGGVLWSRAMGVQADLVAEHALMLALTVLREGTASIRSGTWQPRPAVSLAHNDVLIVGGGSIARALLDLLRPFQVHTTVVRRSGGPVPGAAVTVNGLDRLDELLAKARVVFLALPLTFETEGLIHRARLEVMRSDACLVNVARGGLIVMDDLVQALAEQRISGAGLDVTDPEPLPAGHPLWAMPNCVITAHCGGDLENSLPAFADLMTDNIRLVAQGREPIGLIDPLPGY